MRLTPAQIAVQLICGVSHRAYRRRGEFDTVRKRIVEGHAMLVSITGEDYDFDLPRWHEHLRNTREGGYTWIRKDIELPRVMKNAMANKSWREAVVQLERESSECIQPTRARRS